MKIIAPLLAVVLAWTATSACAQWQWIDKDGRKVFSDRSPPAEIQDKDIIKRPVARAPSTSRTAESADGNSDAASTPAAPASTPKVSNVDKELEAKKKQAADLELAKRRAEEERVTKAKIENCARAKQAKSTYDSGLRLSRVNKAGEPEVIDDATRKAELIRIQSIIDSDCK
jgi:cytoskeletal protein RodZ